MTFNIPRSRSPRPTTLSTLPRRRVMRSALLSLAVLAVLGTRAPAQGPIAAVAAPAPTVHINFVNADLGDVIRSLAVALGVNVVLTDVPARRITFQTPQPVPVSQAGAVLEGILATQGLILVQNGPVSEVLPEDKRPTTGLLHFGKIFPDPAPLGLVTQIIPLEYMRADEAVSLLRGIADKRARIEVVPALERAPGDRSRCQRRTLSRTAAPDRCQNGGRSRAEHVCLRAQARQRGGAGDDIGASIWGDRRVHRRSRRACRTLEGKGAVPPRCRLETRELESRQQRTQIPLQAPPATAAPRRRTARSRAAGRVGPGGLVGSTTIVPDQATNALVIRTAPPNFAVLQETIDRLDVRPPQVLLEVLIAEINLDRNTSTGINWQLYSHAGLQGPTALAASWVASAPRTSRATVP